MGRKLRDSGHSASFCWSVLLCGQAQKQHNLVPQIVQLDHSTRRVLSTLKRSPIMTSLDWYVVNAPWSFSLLSSYFHNLMLSFLPTVFLAHLSYLQVWHWFAKTRLRRRAHHQASQHMQWLWRGFLWYIDRHTSRRCRQLCLRFSRTWKLSA